MLAVPGPVPGLEPGFPVSTHKEPALDQEKWFHRQNSYNVRKLGYDAYRRINPRQPKCSMKEFTFHVTMA